VGIFMGITMILLQVKSPMLVSVGMYLPFGTTSAIFVGGVIRWLADTVAKKNGLNEAQMARFGNTGILMASGMIAGEALMGLVTAGLAILEVPLPVVFSTPSYWVGVGVIGLIAFLLIRTPLANAGDPNEPAPPTAMM